MDDQPGARTGPAPRPQRFLLLGAAITLVACSGGPVGTLHPVGPYRSSADLEPIYREHMVPLIVIGETVYLPSETCAGPMERRLAGAYEDRSLGSAAEARATSGAAEDRALGAAGEERDLGVADESRRVGAGSEARTLAGEDEARDLGADDESRRIGADDEERQLGVDDEDRSLGAGDEARRLGAGADARRLGGGVARLECRRVDDNAFRILEAQRLDPMIFLAGELTPTSDGFVTY